MNDEINSPASHHNSNDITRPPPASNKSRDDEMTENNSLNTNTSIPMQREIYNVNETGSGSTNVSWNPSITADGQTLALGAAQVGATSYSRGVDSWTTNISDNQHTTQNYSGGWHNFSSNRFVGFQNQGATCYLNSLIQSL